jgi:hypothetical protein
MGSVLESAIGRASSYSRKEGKLSLASHFHARITNLKLTFSRCIVRTSAKPKVLSALSDIVPDSLIACSIEFSAIW